MSHANVRKPPARPVLDVLVVDANAKILPDAKVVLKPSDKGGSGVEPRYEANAGAHRARDVKPGTYVLQATAKGLEPQAREIRVGPSGLQEVVVLAKEGAPFIYRGRVKVPFEPRHDLVALAVRPSASVGSTDSKTRQAAPRREGIEELARALGLEPQELPPAARADGFRVYRIPGRTGRNERRELHERLEAHPDVRHVGQVVRFDKEGVAFLSRAFVVRFAPSVSVEEAHALAREHGYTVVRRIPYVPNGYALRSTEPATYETLEACDRLARLAKVEYAEPDLVSTAGEDAVNPTDFLYASQWHLNFNNVDFPNAWQALRDTNAPGVVPGGAGDRTYGDPAIHLAIVDSGVQSQTVGGVTTPRHPDFQGNVTNGQPKVARFFDFANMVANNDSVAGSHGTECAGVATARADNASTVAGENEGVVGSAPNCRLIAIRRPSADLESAYADAYIWTGGFDPGSTTPGFPTPVTPGADVISSSIYLSSAIGAPISGVMRDAMDFLTTYGRGGKGVVLLFSAGNSNLDFRLQRPWAAYEKTIAIAASDDDDVKSSYSNWGPGIDVCAPSSGTPGGTDLRVTTTFLVGAGNIAGHTGGPLDYTGGALDTTEGFGGTSSATPLTAGLAALMLSINPTLTWVEVRHILRTTAERIDYANVDPTGAWIDTDSDGVKDYSQWYGYGRIRAALAVTTARDYVSARDVLVRDNLADTGGVPAAGAFWNSPDIWVRTANPASDPGAIPASYAAAGPHQTPDASLQNWVYVRMKNRGAQASLPFYVRVYVAHYAGFEFRYPNEFIPTVPPSGSLPSPLLPGTYLLGEQRHDGLAAGDVGILSFEWPSNLVPPKKVNVGGSEVSWHPCLLVELTPHDGPAPTGNHVWDNNNLAQKNLTIAYPDEDGHFAMAAVAGHPENDAETVEIVIDRAKVPAGIRLYARLADPKAMRHLLAAKPVEAARGPAVDLLELQDDAVWEGTAKEGGEAVLTRYVLPRGSLLKVKRGGGVGMGFTAGQHGGFPVAWLSAKETIRLPVRTDGGRLVPLILGGLVDKDVAPGVYEVNLAQVDPSGKRSGGVALNVVVGKKKD